MLRGRAHPGWTQRKPHRGFNRRNRRREGECSQGGGFMSARLISTLLATLLVSATLLPTQVFGEPQASPAPAADAATLADSTSQTTEADADEQVCTSAPRGYARCHARIRTDTKIRGRSPSRVSAAVSQRIPGVPRPAGSAPLGNGGALAPPY